MHKLTLHRETLRQLQAEALNQVAGGTEDTLSIQQICPYTKFNTCKNCVPFE